MRPTLDALAFDATGGDDRRRARPADLDQPDRPRASSSSARSSVVISHPQASAQCARFLRTELPAARGPRRVEHRRRGPRGGRVRPRPGRRSGPRRRRRSTTASCCARGSRTRPATSPGSSGSRPRAPSRAGEGDWRTTLSFSELGADHPGALVEALTEFSSREVNLTRIESRPLRAGGLGRYMFFIDLEGRVADDRRRRGDRGAARQGRERARARQLPARRRAGSREAERGRPRRRVYNLADHGGPR